MILTAKKIVEELDKYIVGQNDAKKTLAIAIVNKYRQNQLSDDDKKEFKTKNIIMKGPTGVGKTEIARRISDIIFAPFVKVEATQYTEIGYVGKDVETIIKDLVEQSVIVLKNQKICKLAPKIKKIVDEILINKLVKVRISDKGKLSEAEFHKFISEGYDAGIYEKEIIELNIKIKPELVNNDDYIIPIPLTKGNDIQQAFNSIFGKNKDKKIETTVEEARKILFEQEFNTQIDTYELNQEAIKLAENTGIVFIDEIDKIVNKSNRNSDAGVSREGVQRDLLPIIDGIKVVTKRGVIDTKNILFIAAGAFHTADFHDLMPELQGRFPVIVELQPLTKNDYISIMSNTKNALIKQYTNLLKVDNIDLKFTKEAINKIADYIVYENDTKENIGARRLYSTFEKLLSDVLYEIEDYNGKKITINEKFVDEKLYKNNKCDNYSKYIL